jgi:hypothetical protein
MANTDTTPNAAQATQAYLGLKQQEKTQLAKDLGV